MTTRKRVKEKMDNKDKNNKRKEEEERKEEVKFQNSSSGKFCTSPAPCLPSPLVCPLNPNGCYRRVTIDEDFKPFMDALSNILINSYRGVQ